MSHKPFADIFHSETWPPSIHLTPLNGAPSLPVLQQFLVSHHAIIFHAVPTESPDSKMNFENLKVLIRLLLKANTVSFLPPLDFLAY